MIQRCDDAHHMLHRIWKRIRFCPCSTGMIMRKTAIRRHRKNTMVWMIMPAGERSELQGLNALHPAHPLCSHNTAEGGVSYDFLLETLGYPHI